MIADKLIAKFEKDSQKRMPQHANRCSSIGWPCERMLVYSIVRWGDRKLPTPELQAIFNEGNIQERALKLDLASIGIVVNESQSEVAFPEHRLYGHIDGEVRVRRSDIPVDFKSMSANIFDKMNAPEDFETSKHPYHRCYVPQLQMYMHGRGRKKGLLVIKNKNTGWVKEIEVSHDKKYCQAILDKCIRINNCVDRIRGLLFDTYQIKEIADFDKKKDREDYDAIRQAMCRKIDEVLPERINENTICESCPFNHICLPDEIREERARMWINEKLESQLIERESIKVYRDQYEELDKAVKEVIKESNMDYFLCGDYEVTVSRGKNVRVNIERRL